MTPGAQAKNPMSASIEEALRRRDPAGALRLLDQAEAAAPSDIGLKMQRAVAFRLAGDLNAAAQALDAALALDPYNFVALLGKGAVIERLAGERRSAETYRNALKIAPGEVPPALAPAVARAREVVSRTADELEACLCADVADLLAQCSGATRARAEESVRIFAGKQKAYHCEPLLLHYPRLAAIPFYDRELFPWLPELEAATGLIQAELEGVLKKRAGFDPYIAFPPGVPVNQWAELNHSENWTSYFLWKDGERQPAADAECPKTMALLDRLPLARQPGFAPTVVFSALAAKTHIPPHTGSTNARLLVHLPLVLPGPARFRVGGDTREWRMGEAWVFDDTLEHEAWNDADQLRVIMILDVWNPFLETAERELVTAMLAARKRFFSA